MASSNGAPKCGWRLALSAIATIAGLTVAVPPALATFPGTNGRITYLSNTTANGTMSVFLTDTGQLTFPGTAFLESTPAVSPDGSQVAFIRLVPSAPQDNLIMVVGTDGLGLRTLVHSDSFGESATLRGPGWSGNGQRLSFIVSGTGTATDGIWTINSGGSGLSQTIPGLIINSLNWVPEGHELVYACAFRPATYQSDLCVYDDTSKQIRQLPIDYPGRSSASVGGTKWTPDGRKIVFQMMYSTREGANSHYVERWDIFSVNANGTGLMKLTDSGAEICPDYPSLTGTSRGTHVYQSPTPSPDGTSMIVYRWTNVRGTSPTLPCPFSIQEKGLYRMGEGGGPMSLVLAVPGMTAGTDWEPLPADLTVKVDDGHGNPLSGLKLELTTLEGVVIDDSPINGVGSYHFEVVPEGSYRVRATLIDRKGDAGPNPPPFTPSFEIRHGPQPLDTVWAEWNVRVDSGASIVLTRSFADSPKLAFSSVDGSGHRDRLDDLATLFFRTRQFVDWTKLHLTPDTGPTVKFFAFATTDPTSGVPVANDAAYHRFSAARRSSSASTRRRTRTATGSRTPDAVTKRPRTSSGTSSRTISTRRSSRRTTAWAPRTMKATRTTAAAIRCTKDSPTFCLHTRRKASRGPRTPTTTA